ncbi:NACHT domain-containing protein [Streptomyces daliensis]
MEPATLATRLASSAVAPLVKKLFAKDGPGAGLVDRPVRISGLVSFKGEKRTLTEADLHKLAGELVRRAAEAAGPHDAPSPEERRELTEALAVALHSLGDLDMDDVQAVRLGPEGLAQRLARPRGLSESTEAQLGPLLHTACLHILDFFSRRSTFIPRALTEQTQQIDHLVAATDLLIARVPSQRAEDARFEQQYVEHIARKHGELTIYGLDLNHAREWRLDSAYISLEATHGHGAGVPLAAERALSGHDRVLLRGAAGSGKTTLVQWLAVTTARQVYDAHLPHLIGRVPFVLPLRRVVREGLPPTPDRFLHAVRSAVAGAQPDGWADRVLRAGRALLLVDGIDEIPENERESVRRWARELMGDFPGNLWLITSRPSAVRDDWLTREGFAELTLSPMSRADVGAFVRRWHGAAEADPSLGETLLASIRTNADLGRLAVNPLMCGLLCALHRERNGFLPHGRKDLYDAALSMLLERRDVERDVIVDISADRSFRPSKETQIQLLQKLAHWMIRNDRAEMEQSDAVAQIERALVSMAHVSEPAERVFRWLLERSGLLREPAAGRVDFVHRTFQDYLGAKAAVEEGDFPLVIDNAHRDQWEDVVRMAVAHARPHERARILEGLVAPVPREGLTNAGRAHYRNGDHDASEAIPVGNILLAAVCLEQATELAPEVREKVIGLTSGLLPPEDAFMADLLTEGGAAVLGLLPGPDELPPGAEPQYVVMAATRIAGEAALPLLVRYRDEPSLAVRRQLAWAWHRFETEEYATEILAHLDETDLYFCAHNTDHLRALRALGGRPRVQIVGPYRPADLTTHLAPDRLTHLWLRDGYVGTGEPWLTAFPHLHTLVLPSPPRDAAAATIPEGVEIVNEADVAEEGADEEADVS